MLFQGKPVENPKTSYFFFNCDNEKLPYDFMQKDPLYLNDFIEDFSIEEIEMTRRDERSELTKVLKERKDLA